jgi:hypothetical protein
MEPTHYLIGEALLNTIKNLCKLALCFTLATQLHSGVPQSAVITLRMPVGARQLGMGEAGAALHQDAFSVYWNPAGLAFGPIADEWTLERNFQTIRRTPTWQHLALMKQQGFLSRAHLWAGGPAGLVHFDGKTWRDHYVMPLTGNLSVRAAVRQFTGSEHNLDSLYRIVQAYNDIASQREETFLMHLKLPFSLILQDPVTALVYDERMERLWVGTRAGLFRFSQGRWTHYYHEIGSSEVTSLSLQGTILWVGTRKGIFRHAELNFDALGQVLPTRDVTDLTWCSRGGQLWAAVHRTGLARFSPSPNPTDVGTWVLYRQEDGLLDEQILNVVCDELGYIWTSHQRGLSFFDGTRWEQIHFENIQVRHISIDPDGSIWISASEGAWKFVPPYKDAEGLKFEDEAAHLPIGSWFHHHNRNGMAGTEVFTSAVVDRNAWFATDAGFERFHQAGAQVGLFYENLLPTLNIPDLFHVGIAATFPTKDWGTFGMLVNFVSFGQNMIDDSQGNTLAYINSNELVLGFSYGTKYNNTTALGTTIKIFYSNLANQLPGRPDAKAAGYALDLGLLKKDLFTPGLDLGLALLNAGPHVKYSSNSRSNPLPLTWRLGVAYPVLRNQDWEWIATAEYSRESLYEDSDGEAAPFYVAAWKSLFYPGNAEPNDSPFTVMYRSLQVGTAHLGTEVVYSRTFAMRMGYLYDHIGMREELDIGFGIYLSDILQIDMANIRDLSGNDVRNNQFRFSLLAKF